MATKKPRNGIDYQLIAGKQYTIPPPPKRMGKGMVRRITLARSLMRQIIRADAKGQMERCHKLSKKLNEQVMSIEGHYWHLAPIEIAGWVEAY